ncbi:MAG: hypothetical protein N2513_09355 [Deltaproteobacteria bacterium]|nr:hypothetical protein [Deltaproteobacteria bacterium]
MTTLILSTDDVTGKPLYGIFRKEEDLDGCFTVCREVFRKYGLPSSFYLDRASHFTTTRHGGIHINQKDDKPTHFEMAIFADSLKKGREDKRYIPGQTGGRIWLFGHEPKDKVSAWRKIPGHLNIDNILCRRYERKVKNDNTVSVNGQIR